MKILKFLIAKVLGVYFWGWALRKRFCPKLRSPKVLIEPWNNKEIFTISTYYH